MNKGIAVAREARLLEKVAEGDHAAFRELYESMSRSLYFYLYRMLRDESLAEDVQVEVFTQVWKGAGKFRGQSQVKTWIFGIARNLAMNALRKHRHHANIDDYQDIADVGQPDPEDADRRRFLQKAMDMISDKHRDVLDYVFYQQMTYQEIAEILDISENTVKTRVFYAKAALRKAIGKLGVKRDEI
jgi:RNA polymerase sigma-70 factor (ECF subfamily)